MDSPSKDTRRKANSKSGVRVAGLADGPKKDGAGLYVTSKHSVEIGFKFAKDGNCAPLCPRNRAQYCQHYLLPHSNDRGKKTGGG